MKEKLTQKQMMMGLEANAGLTFDQIPGVIAGRYGVSVETVEECREATTDLHEALTVLFNGENYWEELSLTAFFGRAKLTYSRPDDEED